MPIQHNDWLTEHNTLALPARARAVARIHDDAALQQSLRWAGEQGLSVVPMGEGSNVVLLGDLDCLIVRMENRGIEVTKRTDTTVTLRIAAGENWHGLVQWCLAHGYFGLENLALIPGSVGAAPIQNIGAYGVEVSSFLREVESRRIDDGSRVLLSASDCELAYRDSVFKHALRDQLVIYAVSLQLQRVPNPVTHYPALADHFRRQDVGCPTPQEVFDAVVAIRSAKLPDPTETPNVGSFFKNPLVEPGRADELRQAFPELPCYSGSDSQVKLSAAWMIDHCGWKGRRAGPAGVHCEHALVLVNHGGATGADVLALAADIAAGVQQTFGVQLDIEPRIYGAAE
ncbi:MAG: UDP-N-acetylmuramate dehydrogenase [Pseudomonadota bacterium]